MRLLLLFAAAAVVAGQRYESARRIQAETVEAVPPLPSPAKLRADLASGEFKYDNLTKLETTAVPVVCKCQGGRMLRPGDSVEIDIVFKNDVSGKDVCKAICGEIDEAAKSKRKGGKKRRTKRQIMDPFGLSLGGFFNGLPVGYGSLGFDLLGAGSMLGLGGCTFSCMAAPCAGAIAGTSMLGAGFALPNPVGFDSFGAAMASDLAFSSLSTAGLLGGYGLGLGGGMCLGCQRAWLPMAAPIAPAIAPMPALSMAAPLAPALSMAPLAAPALAPLMGPIAPAPAALPIAMPLSMPVAQPYPVPIPQRVPIPQAVPIPKPVAVPRYVDVPVPRPVDVPVVRRVDVPVPRPVSVPVVRRVDVPVARPIPIARPVPVPIPAPAPMPVIQPVQRVIQVRRVLRLRPAIRKVQGVVAIPIQGVAVQRQTGTLAAGGGVISTPDISGASFSTRTQYVYPGGVGGIAAPMDAAAEAAAVGGMYASGMSGMSSGAYAYPAAGMTYPMKKAAATKTKTRT